jgi:hypothetical protein
VRGENAIKENIGDRYNHKTNYKEKTYDKQSAYRAEKHRGHDEDGKTNDSKSESVR